MKRFFISIAVFSLVVSTAFAGGHSGDKHSGDGHHKMSKKNYFESMDVDGSGGVSMDEFMTKHKEKFSKIDTDGNGDLSAEEISAHHSHKKAKHH